MIVRSLDEIIAMIHRRSRLRQRRFMEFASFHSWHEGDRGDIVNI